MRRILLVTGVALALLLVVLAGGLAWIVGTEPGTRFALAQVQRWLPAGVQVGEAHGRLADHLELHHVSLDQPGALIRIDRLRLVWSPRALLRGRLDIAKLGALGVSYRAQPDDEPPAAEPFVLPDRVELPLAVRIHRLDVEDVEAALEPQAAPVHLNRLTLDQVSFVDSRWRIGSLDLEAPLADAAGSLSGRAAGDYPLRAALTWEVRPEGLAPVAGRTRLDGSLADLELEQRLEPPYRLALEGHVRNLITGGPVSADLEATWRDLSWPLTGPPTVTSPQGTLHIEGPVSGYRYALDTRLEPREAPPVNLTARGRGDSTSTRVSLQARTPGGQLTGNADASWEGPVRVAGEIDARDVDPAVVAPDWPGAIDLSLAASAHLDGEDLSVTVSRLEGDGTLREQALDFSGSGRYRRTGDTQLGVIDELTASLGATRLALDGELAERLSASWHVTSPDLSTLVPEARGRLESRGQISGTLPRVQVDATLEGQELAYGEHRLAHLDVEADVDLAGAAESVLRLEGREAVLAGTAVERVVLEGTGTPAAHRLELAADGAPGQGSIALEGTAEDLWGPMPRWRFTLTEGALSYGDLAPWHLAEAAGGRLSAEGAMLDRQCWTNEDGRLCLEGRQSADGASGTVQLERLDFAYVAGLLPEQAELSGAVAGAASVTLPATGPPLGEGRFETTAGVLSLPLPAPDPEAEPPALRLEPSTVEFELSRGRASGQLALNLELGHLRLQGELMPPADADASLGSADVTARLALEVPDLAFVSTFVPAIEDVTGEVGGELSLTGTLDEPDLGGSLELADAGFYVPETGVQLRAVRLSLQGLGERLGVAGSARSGDGELRLAGDLALPADAPAADLVVAGNDFEVLDNDDGRVDVSPDLRVEADAERLALTGTLHVPQATLTPGAPSESAVTVSEDQVLLGEETEPAAPARQLEAEVRLTLGDDVRVDAFGLTGRIEGNVLLEQEPESQATATGELSIVDGEYRAYGQGLVIEEGRIFFAGGPVTEPAVDVRAVRRPREDILVGAHVQGPLDSPTFELFSEPPMTQQEQLSYLVLGRSLEQTPDGQENALSRAALAMGLRGGDFLARNIGEQVGLDQVGIETGSGEAGAPSDPEDAALVVGKYLSPRLYVSYGIGLFNPETVLEMQYEISRRWTLVTQSSSEATGADILYSVERGGGE